MENPLVPTREKFHAIHLPQRNLPHACLLGEHSSSTARCLPHLPASSSQQQHCTPGYVELLPPAQSTEPHCCQGGLWDPLCLKRHKALSFHKSSHHSCGVLCNSDHDSHSVLFCFIILLGLALLCSLFHPLQQIYAKRRDLIDETQCQLPLLFADRGYMLAHRNTCWVTTVLCRARCEHWYFSLAIWNNDCVRRTKNIGKMPR